MRNLLQLSKWGIFDAKRYEQGSKRWQLAVLIENMEDPRMVRGSELFCLLVGTPFFVLFIVGAIIWNAPHQCPIPEEPPENVG